MMTVEQFHLLMFHSMHIAIIFSAERSNLRYIRQPCFVLNKHLSLLRRISGRVFLGGIDVGFLFLLSGPRLIFDNFI